MVMDDTWLQLFNATRLDFLKNKKVDFIVRNNQSLFIKGLAIFSTINLFKFIKNLVKHM
jgi:hypothetical protein